MRQLLCGLLLLIVPLHCLAQVRDLGGMKIEYILEVQSGSEQSNVITLEGISANDSRGVFICKLRSSEGIWVAGESTSLSAERGRFWSSQGSSAAKAIFSGVDGDSPSLPLSYLNPYLRLFQVQKRYLADGLSASQKTVLAPGVESIRDLQLAGNYIVGLTQIWRNGSAQFTNGDPFEFVTATTRWQGYGELGLDWVPNTVLYEAYALPSPSDLPDNRQKLELRVETRILSALPVTDGEFAALRAQLVDGLTEVTESARPQTAAQSRATGSIVSPTEKILGERSSNSFFGYALIAVGIFFVTVGLIASLGRRRGAR